MYNKWPRYVSVAERRAKADKKINKLRKSGKEIYPIEIQGRKITRTFWGNAWCSHLEKFSDFSNRLPRGRTYVRNGSVCHLGINQGQASAIVIGSELYNVDISIAPLAKKTWQTIQTICSGEIGSLLELLQGKLSDNVMKTVTDTRTGLFPQPREIELNCSCPDWAIMCKHVAAVLYGIGARLDESPELLFLLREVDHRDLITDRLSIPLSTRKKRQVSGDLSDIFGIDLDEQPAPLKRTGGIRNRGRQTTAKRVAAAKQEPTKGSKKKSSGTESAHIDISAGIRASHIKTLRKEFDMSQAELSGLLGKSVVTVRSWEGKNGVLKLQRASQTALTQVFAMDKEQAWEELIRRSDS